ncbi:hypothetical protein EDB83DRAFT_260474, partial [Lactarius deliciosus]
DREALRAFAHSLCPFPLRTARAQTLIPNYPQRFSRTATRKDLIILCALVKTPDFPFPTTGPRRVAQRARREGLFRSIRGRGRPLERNSEEHNPFIARDEFLLNRIVRRQGAAPPWVEVQGGLEVAIAAFRTALRRSWVRRAVRVLALTHSRLSLPSLADLRALRDEEWETREKVYHDSALVEVNSLVRKYNALAPYAVRRAYYVREVELANIYDQSAEEILREIERRSRGSRMRAESETTPGGDGEEEKLLMRAPVTGDVRVLKLRDLLWQWIRRRT